MRPRKSLGQNFLINAHAARRIVDLLTLSARDHVMEIGGGRGDLTVCLVDTGARVWTIEYDRALAELLRARFAGRDNLQIVESNILKFEPAGVLPVAEQFKVVGNLPYNITSPILEWIIDRRSHFPEVVIMVQKEVAQRIAAQPGGKDFGSLTVFVQLFYEAERVFDLKPGSFFPAPKVSSSVVRLVRRHTALVGDADFPSLRRLTSACFRWRRKQLLRILREEYSLPPETAASICQELAIEPSARPEQLAVTQFVVLANKLAWLTQEPSSS